MMSVVSFLTKTYTGASLKAQAGLLLRHVASMDVPASQKRKMEPRIPTGGRVDSMVFKKAIAESLANADRAFASKSDKEVQGCSLRAELEVEARKRQVDIAGVGSGVVKLRAAILAVPRRSKTHKERLDTPKTKAAKKALRTARRGELTGAARKRALDRHEAQGITGVKEDEDGDLVYEVWWKACEENEFDEDEKTWELESCDAVAGGMDALVAAYYEKLTKARASKGNKEKGEKRIRGGKRSDAG